MTASTKKSQNSLKESINDIKVSYILLRNNWREFVKTELFAIGAFFIFILTLFLLSQLLSPVEPRFRPHLEPPKPRNQLTFILLGLIVFYAFISSQFGLAHDVIMSGDMFTEFASSFEYFKTHFFTYALLSLIIIWLPLVFIFEFSFRYFIEFTSLNLFRFGIDQINLFFELVSVYFVQFVFFVIFNVTLAGISSHGSLVKGIKENFTVLIHYPKRIITSWSIFFILFSLPVIIVITISIFLATSVVTGLFSFLGILVSILMFSSIVLGYPLMSLMTTRIYSTTINPEME